jgi:hypothetical protein
MSTRIVCPRCSAAYVIKEGTRTGPVRCLACGTMIPIGTAPQPRVADERISESPHTDQPVVATIVGGPPERAAAPFRPSRKKRRPREVERGVPLWLLLGGGVAVLLVGMVVAGGVVWLLMRPKGSAAPGSPAEPVAAVPEAERRPPDDIPEPEHRPPDDAPAPRKPRIEDLGIKPPSLDKDKVVRELPAPIGDVAVGGGGRFLILSLPSVRKLAVFDVNEAKVVHYIGIAEDGIKFTAGRDKLMVVLPGSNIVQRWSLATFEREGTAVLPIKGEVRALSMGSASAGPLVLHTKQEFGFGAGLAFVDVATLRPIEVGWVQGGGLPHIGDNMHIRGSPDGRAFGLWCTSHTPSGLTLLTLVGTNGARALYDHSSVGHLIPVPEAKVVYTGLGLFSDELKAVPGERPEAYSFLPAVRGPYYLGFPSPYAYRPPPPPGRQASPEPPRRLSVFLQGDGRPFATLPDVELPALRERGEMWVPNDFTYDKRIHLIPEAKLVVVLPTSNDRLVVYRFDADAALEKSGLDYLFVTSRAPPTARRGERFVYPLEVRSRHGGLKYKLESGPPGMTVSDGGKIAWRVPAGGVEPEVTVIVAIRDARGRECFHTFTVQVTNP